MYVWGKAIKTVMSFFSSNLQDDHKMLMYVGGMVVKMREKSEMTDNEAFKSCRK